MPLAPVSLSRSRRSASPSSTRPPRCRTASTSSTSSRVELFAALAAAAARHPRGARDRRAARVRATGRRTSTRPSCARSATTCSSGGGATSAARASTSTAACARSRSSSRARAGAPSSTGWQYDHAPRDELSEPALRVPARLPRAARTAGRPTASCGRRWRSPTRASRSSAPELGERLTCDFDLAFSAPDGTSGRLADGLVIVESKSPRGNAVADRALRALGARPEPRLLEVLPRRRLHEPARAAATGCGRCCGATSAPRPRRRGARARRRPPPAAAAEVPRVDLRAAKTIRDDPKVAGPADRRRPHVPRRDRAARQRVAARSPRSRTRSRPSAACGCSACRASATGTSTRSTPTRRCCATCSRTTRPAGSGSRRAAPAIVELRSTAATAACTC